MNTSGVLNNYSTYSSPPLYPTCHPPIKLMWMTKSWKNGMETGIDYSHFNIPGEKKNIPWKWCIEGRFPSYRQSPIKDKEISMRNPWLQCVISTIPLFHIYNWKSEVHNWGRVLEMKWGGWSRRSMVVFGEESNGEEKRCWGGRGIGWFGREFLVEFSV